ncbi:hypothetical protein Ahy_A06g028824 [Arachis hypogaea]|uniref:Uncharacterized protein n=1 Tax=Arachis hypogaea TaxID=3818 RepID=A0A445CRY2_ARAHY|nr:hypothetical protein Ahy_A06g028824 [Arachis hypogaea]
MHTLGGLHCKSGLVHFVYEYDNVLGNKERKKLEDDDADSKEVITYVSNTSIERKFQQKYTSKMFKDIQLELKKKSNCVIQSNEHQGDSISVKMDE